MPALIKTITAVDHTNDLLTCAAHGLLTGAGPCTPRNFGGALPTGLAALTDYWFIRIDANTFKLASSSANALAGTPVNLTANGSGTTILEFGIPFRRSTDYAPGVQVKSEDLKDMQDAFKAFHALLTGQAQSIVTESVITKRRTLYFSAAGCGTPDSNAPDLLVDHSGGGAVAWDFNAPAEVLPIALDRLRTGDKIISFGARANTTLGGGAEFKVKLWYSDPTLGGGTGNSTQVGATLTHANIMGDDSHTLVTPHTIADGQSFHMTVGEMPVAETGMLFDVFVVIERPPS